MLVDGLQFASLSLGMCERLYVTEKLCVACIGQVLY